MKNFILVLTLVSVGFVSNGQNSLSTVNQSTNSSNESSRNTEAVNTPNSLGDVASLQKEVAAVGTFKYTFQSDVFLEAGKVDRLTGRFIQQFPQIIDLQLVSSTQQVIVTLSDTHSEQDLLEIVQRFDYLSYNILE